MPTKTERSKSPVEKRKRQPRPKSIPKEPVPNTPMKDVDSIMALMRALKKRLSLEEQQTPPASTSAPSGAVVVET